MVGMATDCHRILYVPLTPGLICVYPNLNSSASISVEHTLETMIILMSPDIGGTSQIIPIGLGLQFTGMTLLYASRCGKV